MSDVQFTITEQPLGFSTVENPIGFTVGEGVLEFTVQQQALSFPVVSESIEFAVGNDAVTFEVQGIFAQGTPGQSGIAEEEMTYAKRVDWISESVLYKGEAAVGTANSAAVWRIRRVTLGSDDDVTEVWADGTDLFDKTWDDRATYAYS